MTLNKINPNPKPRFPKGKTHKDMRIVRPIDLDPIVDAINENSENIDNITESFIPFTGGGLLTGNILVNQGVGIVNENENYGILHGLTSPVSTNKLLLMGDIYNLSSPPTTGIANSLLIGGSAIGVQDVYFSNQDFDNDIVSYLSIGSNGTVLRRDTGNTNRAYMQCDENGDVLIFNRNDEGSDKKIQIVSENHDGVQNSHEINVLADHIKVSSKGGGNVLSLFYLNLPIYADNTAATGAGLLTDQVYKTATGELRIVV